MQLSLRGKLLNKEFAIVVILASCLYFGNTLENTANDDAQYRWPMTCLTLLANCLATTRLSPVSSITEAQISLPSPYS